MTDGVTITLEDALNHIYMRRVFHPDEELVWDKALSDLFFPTMTTPINPGKNPQPPRPEVDTSERDPEEYHVLFKPHPTQADPDPKPEFFGVAGAPAWWTDDMGFDHRLRDDTGEPLQIGDIVMVHSELTKRHWPSIVVDTPELKARVYGASINRSYPRGECPYMTTYLLKRWDDAYASFDFSHLRMGYGHSSAAIVPSKKRKNERKEETTHDE